MTYTFRVWKRSALTRTRSEWWMEVEIWTGPPIASRGDR